MSRKVPKIEVIYEPDASFNEDFLGFVEDILNYGREISNPSQTPNQRHLGKTSVLSKDLALDTGKGELERGQKRRKDL
jgi:hypothetical protein